MLSISLSFQHTPKHRHTNSYTHTHTHLPGQMAMLCALAQQMHKSINHEKRLRGFNSYYSGAASDKDN